MASGFRSGDRARAKELFRKMPRSVRKASAVALDSAAEELAEAIKRRVPVDSGALRDTVRWARGKPAVSRRGKTIEAAGADADLTVRVVEGDEETGYVYLVEFGASDRPAQPHFFPTWRSLKKRLASRIKRAQAKAIKEAAKNV